MMYPINYSASKSFKNVTAMVIEPMEKVAGNSVLHGQAVTAFADEDGTMILNGGLMFMLQGPKSELERLLKDRKALMERVQYYLAETDEMTPEEAAETNVYSLFGLMLDDEPIQSVEESKEAIIIGARLHGKDVSQEFIDTVNGISEEEIYYAEMMEADDALRAL